MTKHESQSHDPTAAVGLLSVMAVRRVLVDIAMRSNWMTCHVSSVNALQLRFEKNNNNMYI